MDSNRIRNLATGAREALRAEVSARLGAVLAEGSRERLEEPARVRALEADLAEHGRDEVVDRAAYTWFNRLCALRFMDANGHTPTPVVTPREGSTQPAVLADAARGAFDPDYAVPEDVKRKVTGLLSGTLPSANAAEDAYSLLLAAVCARYAGPMGYLFAEGVASPLLMPQGLLSQGSILSRIVSEMDGGACSSVEVLGWLYQFYVAERKDEVFAAYKRGKKAQAADIAPATQLFTPEWIVRYLTENSLGRLWALNNPGSELAESMDYYVAPEGDEPHIEVSSADEIRVLDPACGSGHILVYAFDLLFQMYEEEGWPEEEIPALVLQNNLFGLEIDRRAAEIASFALEMKALAHDPGFLGRDVDAHVRVLEPVELSPQELALVPGLAGRERLLEAMAHLDEVGSLYVPDPGDAGAIEGALGDVRRGGSLFAGSAARKLDTMLQSVRALSGTFHCVVANPPYMGSGNMNPWLSSWVKKNYPDEKGDLCTCFIERGLGFSKAGGYASLVTMHSWMFLGSFEGMRRKIVEDKGIVSMAHLGARAFDAIGGEVVQTTATVFANGRAGSQGSYLRLVDLGSSDVKRDALLEAVRNPECGWSYRADADDFKAIPGWPIAYWAGMGMKSSFEKFPRLADVAGTPQKGLDTCDVDRFVRYWYEVGIEKVDFHHTNDTVPSRLKWFPYAKGGDYRKWYGNNLRVVNWENEGNEIRNYRQADGRLKSRPQNIVDYFKPMITWTAISSGNPSMRFNSMCIYGGGGTAVIPKSDPLPLLAYLNSCVALTLLRILSPTLNYEAGHIAKLPWASDALQSNGDIKSLAKGNVDICQSDWDSFETSWDFARHPLVRLAGDDGLLSSAYARWEAECRGRFDELKANEEELNRTFARIFNMEGEVPIEVPDDKVSVRLADRARDARSLVSYAVGCMLGRWSDEADGLVLADQGATVGDFRARVPQATYLPDADGVLPVLSAEWFGDDAVAGLRAWLAHAFGEGALDENVAWLEESLGRDLRSYLVRDFYADHVRTYQKRPVYWMFQSPKKSFQCLVYLHRYDEGTVGTVLTGYLRPLEDKLRARLSSLDAPGASAADAREANRVRAMVAELEQWEREVVYPLAHERVSIDLDDGVKANYNRFPRALAKVPGLSDWK